MKNLSWMIVFFTAVSMSAQAEEPKQNEGCKVQLRCEKMGDFDPPYTVKIVRTKSCQEGVVAVTISDHKCTNEGQVRMTFNQ